MVLSVSCQCSVKVPRRNSPAAFPLQLTTDTDNYYAFPKNAVLSVSWGVKDRPPWPFSPFGAIPFAILECNGTLAKRVLENRAIPEENL